MIEHGRTFADRWFASHFDDGLDKGTFVNVEVYYRRATSDDSQPWRRLADAGYFGQVWSRPTASTAYNGKLESAVCEGVTVLPSVPQPAGDCYASGHPLSISNRETALTIAGTAFLLRHTVEAVDLDGVEPEIPNEIPVHLELSAVMLDKLVELEAAIA